MNANVTTARRARALAAAAQSAPFTLPQREDRAALIVVLLDMAGLLEQLPAPLDGERAASPYLRDSALAVLPLLGEPSGVPAALMTYVVEPLTRRAPELPPLDSGSEQLTRQEERVREGVDYFRRLLDTEDDAQLTDAFGHLLALHRQYLRIGASVAVQNGRPRSS